VLADRQRLEQPFARVRRGLKFVLCCEFHGANRSAPSSAMQTERKSVAFLPGAKPAVSGK
jgi:hypothetical protein